MLLKYVYFSLGERISMALIIYSKRFLIQILITGLATVYIWLMDESSSSGRNVWLLEEMLLVYSLGLTLTRSKGQHTACANHLTILRPRAGATPGAFHSSQPLALETYFKAMESLVIYSEWVKNLGSNAIFFPNPNVVLTTLQSFSHLSTERWS